MGDIAVGMPLKLRDWVKKKNYWSALLNARNIK